MAEYNLPLRAWHEIVGTVTKIGQEVTKFKVGDLAGVRRLVDFCKEYPSCPGEIESYCEKGQTFT